MKENYNLKFEEIISKLDHKPKLLLHSCCAPCSSHVITLLKDYFDVTVFFYNPNIYPLQEYEKRKQETIRLINIFNEEFNTNIKNCKFLKINVISDGPDICYLILSDLKVEK